MTTSVVTVDRITSCKEIARLLTEHRVSGVPVLTMGRHVAGVVSEADLLAVEDERTRRLRAGEGRLSLLRRGPQHLGLTAAELMTAPAVTVKPDTPVPSAARIMTANHLRRLPVVDDSGKLIGIVTRRDLLSAFLRPDGDIAADAAELLDEVAHVGPDVIKAVVRDGRVILTGTTQGPSPPRRSLTTAPREATAHFPRGPFFYRRSLRPVPAPLRAGRTPFRIPGFPPAGIQQMQDQELQPDQQHGQQLGGGHHGDGDVDADLSVHGPCGGCCARSRSLV